MNPEIILKKIEPDDLPKIARVHINSFPDSALTRLGTTIVERYYLWQLTGPHKKVQATGAFINDDCAGFSFSGIFNGSTGGFVLQNKNFLVKEVLLHPQLLFNRSFLKRIKMGVKSLRRFKKVTSATALKTEEMPRKLSYGILSIAVSNDFQKLGIGKLLMLDAEQEAVRCGYEEINLSVHPANKNAVRFYENQNWRKTPANELWRGVMVKPLN